MSATVEDIKMLSAEFDKADIHWRAQTLMKDGSKAMALAYIDARNVMDRLDQCLGVENWQDRYEFHGARTICYLSINIDGEWITKADGAGDTAVEGEKGSISDALKRAAVKWGIGRYLYAMPAPWVPCDSYQSEWNGKKKLVWKGWKADPWEFVKGSPQQPKATARDKYKDLIADMRNQPNMSCLAAWKDNPTVKEAYNSLPADWKSNFADELKAQKEALQKAKEVIA